MKTCIKAVVLAVCIMACGVVEVEAYEWSKQDIAMQAIFTGVQFADWSQTRWMAKHPISSGDTETYIDKDGNCANRSGTTINSEINPILGKHPHKDKVDIYFATSAIVSAVVSHYLPDVVKACGGSDRAAKLSRNVWQSLGIVVEGGFVAHNIKVQGGWKWGF